MMAIGKRWKQKSEQTRKLTLVMIGIQDFIQIIKKLFFNLIEMVIGRFIP